MADFANLSVFDCCTWNFSWFLFTREEEFSGNICFVLLLLRLFLAKFRHSFSLLTKSVSKLTFPVLVSNSLFSSPGGKTLFQRVNTIYERGSKLVQIDVNLQGPGTLVSISPSHALCYKVPGPPRRGGFALKYWTSFLTNERAPGDNSEVVPTQRKPNQDLQGCRLVI